ncbi:MAG: hypothetical protein WD834_01320, partial [Actinomycetota bacterium]
MNSIPSGGGRSLGVDPEGRVLFESCWREESVEEPLDLDRVSHVREHGTRCSARRERAETVFEPYRRLL